MTQEHCFLDSELALQAQATKAHYFKTTLIHALAIEQK